MQGHAENLRLIKSFGFCLALFGTAFSNSFCGIGLGVYLGGLALEICARRPYPWRTLPARPLLLALLASLLVSVAFSTDPMTSLRGFGKYLQGFALLYAGIDVIRSEREKRWFVWAFTAAILLAVSSGLYQQFTGVDFLRGHRINPHFGDIKRLTGTFKHCNDYGTFLVPGAVFLLAVFLQNAREKKWTSATLWLALLAGLGWTLMQTLSRGAILSVFAALVFFCLFFRFRWVALGAVAALSAAVWFIPSPLADRLHELPTLGAGDLSERFTLIRISLEMIRANPVFGLGLNTYSENFPRFKPADYDAYMYSHNSYLQMATEAGLLGTTLFVAYILVVMWRCRKGRDLTGFALLAGVFGILVNCLFESALQSTQLRTLFWSLLGAALALAAL